VEPLAPHEKIYVDSEIAEDENHGEIGCHECHGGDPKDPNWKTAHKGVVKDPSYPDPSEACGSCHDDIAENYQTSLHVSLSPFKKMMDMRANSDKAVHAKVNGAREFHCNACHSSCGQCHISRPESVGGGLLEGHLFQKSPPMQQVCTACHGSRIEKEYFGKNKGIPPDIHKQKYFKCSKCHKADEMHGDGKDYANRYEVENGPKCVGCHKDIYDKKSENAKNHGIHKDKVSCHVCHSMPYKNCYSCHVGKDKHGLKFFKTEGSPIDFKIGLNPLQTKKRPERFVTVRHVPVDKKTFDFYAKDGLTNFDKLPTWKLATPHNIRRKTPQNKTCNACHGNKDLFLLKKDVKPEYLKANKSVIVSPDLIPEKQKEK
jgi:thiosulfate/3-mercaptopyruvate sulfurtransferase